MDDLAEQTRHALAGPCGVARGDRLLLAVSGGVDSMVLMRLCLDLRETLGLELAVAHFNHGLRGGLSDADEAFVGRAARRAGLPFFRGGGDVRALARQRGVSIEMAARELRFEFLAHAASEAGALLVATAHHADDQVELFLIRAARGAGGAGLSGMKFRTHFPGHARLAVVRPLLGATKPAIQSWASQRRVRFRTDASNQSSAILRNRIRHRVMPAWEESVAPGLVPNVLRSMRILGDEASFVESMARAWIATPQSRPTFTSLHVALQRQILRCQFLDLGIEATFENIEFLRSRPDTTALSLSSNRRVALDGTFCLRELPPAPPGFSELSLEVRLDAASGRVDCQGLRVDWEIRDTVSPAWVSKSKRGVEVLDADRVGSQVVLRFWHPGDRFQPCGMPRSSKLQNLLTNAKVPAAERRRRWLAVGQGGDIFWVDGLRVGEIFKVTDATRRFLVWSWKGTPP